MFTDESGERENVLTIKTIVTVLQCVSVMSHHHFSAAKTEEKHTSRKQNGLWNARLITRSCLFSFVKYLKIDATRLSVWCYFSFFQSVLMSEVFRVWRCVRVYMQYFQTWNDELFYITVYSYQLHLQVQIRYIITNLLLGHRAPRLLLPDTPIQFLWLPRAFFFASLSLFFGFTCNYSILPYSHCSHLCCFWLQIENSRQFNDK